MSQRNIIVDDEDDIQLDTSESTVNSIIARRFGMEEDSATIQEQQFDSELTDVDVKDELERIFKFNTIPRFRKDYNIDLYINNVVYKAQTILQHYVYYRPLLVKLCDFKITYKSTVRLTDYGPGLFVEKVVENDPLVEKDDDPLSGKHLWLLVEQVTNLYLSRISRIVYTWLLINIVPHSIIYREERETFFELVKTIILDNGLYTNDLDAVIKELLSDIKWMVVFIASTYNKKYIDIYRKLIII